MAISTSIKRILLLILFLLPALTLHALEKTQSTKPNILMIIIDDLNDWQGCYGGHPQAHTPNIDKLASQGTLFANAHCQAPICKPSRDSFMTSRQPSTTGIYLLGNFHFSKSPALNKNEAMPTHFAKHGYNTFGTGKIFHSGPGMECFQTRGPGYSFGPRPKQKHNYKIGHPLWDWGAYPEKDAQLTDKKCTDWAIKQIKQKQSKPYFLAVGLVRTHVPLYTPKKWWDRQPAEQDIKLPLIKKDDTNDIPSYGLRLTAGFPAPRQSWFDENKPQQKRITRAYLACIDFVDHQVGRMLKALKESGQDKNTIVVLFSDHGFHMGEKNRWAKRSLWEESTRVPLIIRAPSHTPNQTSTQPAGLIDIYPTLNDLAQIPQAPNLQGHSLLPQLKKPSTPRNPAITTFYVNNHSVRSEHYRYIRYADGSQELYDHRIDPNEWNNLAHKSTNPKIASIIAYHKKHLPKTNVAPVPGNAALGVAPDDRKAFNVKN